MLLMLSLACPLYAQQTPPPPPPQQEEVEQPQTAETVTEQEAVAGDDDAQLVAQQAPVQAAQPQSEQRRADPGRESFPNLNLYLPEGEFDLRARKLIRNVLFESQLSYNFVDGDVSTFLRYKYYARDFTYKIGVFDEIEFESIDSRSGDFDRVRGGLLQFEYPANYNQRYFLLTQVDGLTFGDASRPENNRNNVYTKIGYQQGTPFDERLNAIVGESRGRIAPVLTAYRDIGPQKLGLALALTQALSGIGGDYQYTKIEGETLKRWDLTTNSFVITRLHAGSFLQKEESDVPPPDDSDIDPDVYRYAIPRYELFRLGGRDAMKGVDNSHARGTDEVHLTNEFFFPVFRHRDYRWLGARWSNLYAIGYTGVGSVGFGSEAFTELDDYVVDAGTGFEATFAVRNFEVFMSAVYAHTVTAPPEIEGGELRFAVRTSR